MRKTFILAWTALICIFYVSLNVYASQFVYSPLMFRLLTLKDPDAARQYLANLEGSALYNSQSRYFNSIFDNIFAREVDENQLNTRKTIVKYERLLALNQKNRDVLVKLALLYRAAGDTDRAQEYYKRAQAVDPWIMVKEMER